MNKLSRSCTKLDSYYQKNKSIHFLDYKDALPACFELMVKLEKKQTLDLWQTGSNSSKEYSTLPLFLPAGGKMFGVLMGKDSQQNIINLYAFSGQYNGKWKIPGWVPPVFNINAFQQLTVNEEKKIKKLGMWRDIYNPDSKQYKRLSHIRKKRSQRLMDKIFDLYYLRNFQAQCLPMRTVFTAPHGMPTGTGDCCLPKLLHHAAIKNITPLAMAEFYWGSANSSGSRQHGEFYPPCLERCTPLLEYFLSGLQKTNVRRN